MFPAEKGYRGKIKISFLFGLEKAGCVVEGEWVVLRLFSPLIGLL